MKVNGKHMLFDNFNEFKEWLLKTKFNRTIKVIQQHNTAEPSYNDFKGNNHFDLILGMERFHIHDREFEMIAQNITTFPDGKLSVNRPFDRSPAGIKGCNIYGICIENLGNFDKNKDSMTDIQKKLIVELTGLLCIKFKINVNTKGITYHHWWSEDGNLIYDKGDYKSCPGSNFFGGNSVENAKNIFYPLVNKWIKDYQHPVTPKNELEIAIEHLIKTKDIRSPEYWLENSKPNHIIKGSNMGQLFINISNKNNIKNAINYISTKVKLDKLFWIDKCMNNKDIDGSDACWLILQLYKIV